MKMLIEKNIYSKDRVPYGSLSLDVLFIFVISDSKF